MNDFITETDISGVFVIKRPTFKDERGFFRETFRKGDLEARTGYELNFVQTNHSRSSKDCVRGIHIAPWHKLVTCTRGLVQQVVVDTRTDSPTFGKHLSIEIGEDGERENHCAVFIPSGLGNGFAVLSDSIDYVYQASDYWAPGKEFFVNYADPDIAIEWQVQNAIVSEADKNHPTLREVFPEKFSS